jgi:hypothetical protein
VTLPVAISSVANSPFTSGDPSGRHTRIQRGRARVWPQACVWLLRLALEASLDEYWLPVDPAVAACRNRRAQILMFVATRQPGGRAAGRVPEVGAVHGRPGTPARYRRGFPVDYRLTAPPSCSQDR